MPNSSLTQQALASDLHFQRRVQSAIANVAWQVIEEPTTTPNHDSRTAYARQVINGIEQGARTISRWLVERPNLLAFETSYDFSAVAVITAAGDADIQSQLMHDWNDLAGAGLVPGPAVAPPPVFTPALVTPLALQPPVNRKDKTRS